MDKPLIDIGPINKINVLMLMGAISLFGGLSGCTHYQAPTDELDATVTPQPASATKVVIKRTPTTVPVAKASPIASQRVGKDKHHLEYEAKKRWYQEQWEQEQKQQQVVAQRRQAPVAQPSNRQARLQLANRSNRAYTDYSENLSNAALERTRYRIRYDGRYIPIAYPNGDVPSNIGVCTDTVIRSYRRLGVDLQSLVHEDISQAFYSYPNLVKWGLQEPDPNIDHRRVLNLKVFFTRNGQRLPVTNNPAHYRPGDLVTWSLGGGQEHIGIVVNKRSSIDPRRYLVVHNIGEGDKLEDVLFKLPITGHYRYFPQYQYQRPYQQVASAQQL